MGHLTDRRPLTPARRDLSTDLHGFADVEASTDPTQLIRALDVGKASPRMRAIGAAMLDSLGLVGPVSVLDIGCGLGDDARTIAAAMATATDEGPAGRSRAGGAVIGVDISTTMVAQAAHRGRTTPADPSFETCPIRFVAGSAGSLPFRDNTFDRCRMQSVLLHVPDPAAVVREIARVTRRGGKLVSFEFDLGATVLDHPDRHTTRRVLDHVTDTALQGWAGRRLPRLCADAGFRDVTVTPYTIVNNYDLLLITMRGALAQLVRDGVLTGRAAVGWVREFERSYRDGRYFSTSTGFLVVATRG